MHVILLGLIFGYLFLDWYKHRDDERNAELEVKRDPWW